MSVPFSPKKQYQEVVTESLSVEQMRDCIPDIIRFLISAGSDHLNVTYGWACSLPQDKLWLPHVVETAKLDTFIERSVRDGILSFGRSDLHIEDPLETIEFTLCHEIRPSFQQ